MNLAYGVDRTLLMNIFTVGISADFVLVVPSYVIKLPPMVIRTRMGFSFSGRSAQTMRAYVIFVPCGIAEIGMTFIVSVLNNFLNSSFIPSIHRCPRLELLSSKYTAGFLVSGLMALPNNANCGAFASM